MKPASCHMCWAATKMFRLEMQGTNLWTQNVCQYNKYPSIVRGCRIGEFGGGRDRDGWPVKAVLQHWHPDTRTYIIPERFHILIEWVTIWAMEQLIRKFITSLVPTPESVSLLTYVVQLTQPLLANGRGICSNNSNYYFIKWKERKQKLGEREREWFVTMILHLVHLPGSPRCWWRSGEPQ